MPSTIRQVSTCTSYIINQDSKEWAGAGGAGAGGARIKQDHILTAEEAEKFTIDKVFFGQPRWVDFEYLFWIELGVQLYTPTVTKQWAQKCVDHKYNNCIEDKDITRSVNVIQSFIATIQGYFRGSVRGIRCYGVITTDESYQHLDLKIILFKTILFKTEGLLGDQIFHFFWQMNALVVKFQIIRRRVSV